MTKRILIILLTIALIVPHAALAAEFGEFDSEQPIRIEGDSVEYFYKQNRAEGRGNVRIAHGDRLLTADTIDVNLATKEAWANGNVVYTQPDNKFEGDSLYVNFDTKSASVEGLKLKAAPFYRGESESVDKVNEDYYVLRNTYLTTCDEGQDCVHGQPLYRMQAQKIEFFPGDRLVLTHVVYYLGHIPIFYLPYLVIPIKDFDRFPTQVEVGSNSEWGAFALTKTRYYLNDDHDGNILADYRENQGFAYGAEHFYHNGPLGEGAIRAYIADDDCSEGDVTCSRSKEYTVNESSRYRAQLRHRGQLEHDTSVNVELNKLSDDRVIQDFFFREEFERIAFPDNYVSLIRATDNYSVSALTRFRLDDHVGVVERLPELRLDTHAIPLGDSNFYLQHQTEGAFLNRSFKDFESSDKDEDAGRLDTTSRLSYVHRVGDWTATPYVANRNTFYTRNLNGDKRDFWRNALESGVDVSTKYFKTFEGSYNVFGSEYEKLRHVFTPNISYFYRSRPTHDANTLFQFDRLDTLDHESRITVDFENKLQGKFRPERDDDDLDERTIIRSISSFEIDIPQGNNSRLEGFTQEVDITPYSWLNMHIEANYDFELDEFGRATFDVSARKDAIRLGFGQRYVNGESNQSTVHFEWDVDKNWMVGLYERFDFGRKSSSDTERNNEFELVLQRRNFYCWTVNLVYNRSHNENGFYITFSPSAFSQTSFRRNQVYRGINRQGYSEAGQRI